MHFRTSNVLLDETFTAKVSDYGLHKLLIEDHHAGSSSAIDCFLDPEYVIHSALQFLLVELAFIKILERKTIGLDRCGSIQVIYDDD